MGERSVRQEAGREARQEPGDQEQGCRRWQQASLFSAQSLAQPPYGRPPAHPDCPPTCITRLDRSAHHSRSPNQRVSALRGTRRVHTAGETSRAACGRAAQSLATPHLPTTPCPQLSCSGCPALPSPSTPVERIVHAGCVHALE